MTTAVNFLGVYSTISSNPKNEFAYKIDTILAFIGFD